MSYPDGKPVRCLSTLAYRNRSTTDAARCAFRPIAPSVASAAAAGAVTTSVEERFFQLREEVTKKGKDKRQIGLRLTESGSLIAFVVTKHNRGVPASPYSSSPTKCSRQRAAPSAAQSFARRALSCTNGRCRLKPSLERVVTRNSPLRGKSGRRATSRIFHRQAARGSECDVRIGRGAAARFGSRSAQG